MRNRTEIAPAEWRWVVALGALLLVILALPYLYVLVQDQTATDWHFMGILANPQDGATYLAKIGQGQRGAWGYSLAHTPEAASGTFIQVFYVALGQLARLIGFSALAMFHLARLLTSFVMFLSLYYLGATIWGKLRSRRLFFGIVAVGSGLGWLALLLLPGLQPVDLYVPEAIPLYAAYTNPHFPLSIAFLALLAAQFVMVFRPGGDALPTLRNGGAVVAVLGVLLALVQPQAWLPFAVALAGYIGLQMLRTHTLPRYDVTWAALMIVPALPILLYDLLLIRSDSLYTSWNAQNQTPSGNPLNYAFGFGLFWVIAAPGIFRAARRFERDGDRFMLVWLITNILLLYAPFNLQRRLVIGLIIPLAYFAARSLEETWLPRVRPARRSFITALVIVALLPSSILALFIPFAVSVNPVSAQQNFTALPRDYVSAIQWLKINAAPGSVVLALPAPSLWIPAYSSARVVYGHPFETVDAAAKREIVDRFYSGQDCTVRFPAFSVRYVLTGPRVVDDDGLTRAIDAAFPCAGQVGDAVARFDTVMVYRVRP